MKITINTISFNSASRNSVTNVSDNSLEVDSNSLLHQSMSETGFGTFGRRECRSSEQAVISIQRSDSVCSVDDSIDSQHAVSERIVTSMGTEEVPRECETTGQKSARVFDVDVMLRETLRTAEQLCAEKVTGENQDRIYDSDVFRSQKEEDCDEDLIGPPLPSDLMKVEKDKDDVSSENSDDNCDGQNDEFDTTTFVPLFDSLTLDHGFKPVTALDVDPAGGRVLTGSLDYTVKCWDFNGMKSSLRPFRDKIPFEGYPMYDIKHSRSGEFVLLTSGSPRVKVVNRDFNDVVETTRGDGYIVDLSHTKGHISSVSCGAWHSRDKQEFMTCSSDCTVRVWRVDTAATKHSYLIRPRSRTGTKTVPTVCAYSTDGHLLAVACSDGSIQMWDHRRSYVNTCMLVRGAHDPSTDTSGLRFSFDDRTLISRGGDDTLKIWDMSKFKSAIHSVDNLYNQFAMTDCVFSPNDRMIATGTSHTKEQQHGHLHVYSRDTFQLLHTVPVQCGHVIRIVWHSRINQLLLGCGDGNCRVFYDPHRSQRGALMCASASSQSRAKRQSDFVNHSTVVITPHALPLFREHRRKGTYKEQISARKDSVKSRRPELPQGEFGTGGKVASGGSTLASHIMRSMGRANRLKEEVSDPREALFRHAKEASENPFWVTPAYSKTQPKTIFYKEDNNEDEDLEAKKRKL